jgi:calcineurin-like phosphoesterase
MRLLYCGDVMGESGREAVAEHVPALRRRLGLDFVVVNGENAAGGFGVTEKICRSFYDWGVDVVTTGNHVWDQREILTFEATSEKAALAYTVDGRASMVVGSHSHVPTADTRILPRGTAFQTDAGMCGNYDSIIGMEKEVAIARFVTKMRTERLEPADGEGSLCAMFVETDDKTGLAKRASPVRIGGALAAIVPD